MLIHLFANGLQTRTRARCVTCVAAIFALVLAIHSAAVQASQASGVNDGRGQPLNIAFDVNGYTLMAELFENRQLLAKISHPVDPDGQTHYKGTFTGYPGSAIRVSHIDGHWRGVLLLNGELHKVDAYRNPGAASSGGLVTAPPDWAALAQSQCASPSMDTLRDHTGHSYSPLQNMTFQAQTLPTSEVDITAVPDTSAATLADVCANPINGVCLLPEIEFAYDLTYQNLVSSETPMQRALREINEMELFFLSGMGFEFSRLSLTMLDATQDALIGASTDPNDLLNRLRILRGSNQLTYLQNTRSIFHFVTGRNLSGNVIGIAYLDQICSGFGVNTGLTDAGGTSLVSLVMAHEIGHNMGADHDEAAVNGCPENRNVMSPSLGSFAAGFTAFSSCSIDSINQSAATALSTACFDFPIDAGIIADIGNPQSPNRVDPFDLEYQINADDGYVQIGSLSIDGVIPDPSEGRFINVGVDGGSCTVTASSYSCTVINPPVSMNLTVTASVEELADEFTVQHSVTTATAHVTDVLPLNNLVTDTLNNFGDASGAPAPQTNGGSAGGGDATGGGGGGGGGAINPLLVAAMIVIAVSRRRRLEKLR